MNFDTIYELRLVYTRGLAKVGFKSHKISVWGEIYCLVSNTNVHFDNRALRLNLRLSFYLNQIVQLTVSNDI